MDDRLKKALDFSNYRISLFNKKEDLKIKFNTMLLHSCNGGNFKITQDLICFVKLMIDSDREDIILIDVNNNPIQITDPSEFFVEIIGKYIEATNFYYSEYSKLKKARSVSKLLDIVADGA